jgi:Ca2+/H+ antiporter
MDPSQQPMMMQSGPSRMSGMAIAGFILSFLCGLLGLIFSIVALNQINRSMGALRGRGLAIAGIIISILGMVAGVSLRACNRGYRRSYYRYYRTELKSELPRAVASLPAPPPLARI